MKTQIALRRLFFTLCIIKTSSFIALSQSQVVRPSTTIDKLSWQIYLRGELYEGTKAYIFSIMKQAYPDGSFTDLMADLEQLPTNHIIQDRFFFVICHNNFNNEANIHKQNVQYILFAISKDASESLITTNYYLKRYKNPPKSVRDLKAKYDKIEARQQRIQDSIENEEKMNKSVNQDSTEKIYDLVENIKLSALFSILQNGKLDSEQFLNAIRDKTNINWNLLRSSKVYTTYYPSADFDITYNPLNLTLTVETDHDDFFKNVVEDLNHLKLKETVNPHKLPEVKKITYLTKDFKVVCTESLGGSMGNTHYQIEISKVFP